VPHQRRQQSVGEFIQVQQALDVTDQFEELSFPRRDRVILAAEYADMA